MKKRFYAALTAAGLALVGYSTAAVGQDKETQAERDRAQQKARESTGQEGMTLTHRASQIPGMTVKNRAGKEIGSIEDIVLDANSGKIRYAAVSYGGFLGLGDKLFAVPWSAFDIRREADDEDEYYLMLDVDEQSLQNAPGFDQNHWPDFADPQWKAVDKFYGERMQKRDRDGGTQIDVNINKDRNRADNQ